MGHFKSKCWLMTTIPLMLPQGKLYPYIILLNRHTQIPLPFGLNPKQNPVKEYIAMFCNSLGSHTFLKSNSFFH